ncbi:MAG: hypothetical protein AABW88_05505 [Nanoarchaeota archaeon]
MTKTIIKTESGSVYELEEHLFHGQVIKRNGNKMRGYIWPTKLARGVNFNEKGHLQYLEDDFKEGKYLLIWDSDEMKFMNSNKVISVMKE